MAFVLAHHLQKIQGVCLCVLVSALGANKWHIHFTALQLLGDSCYQMQCFCEALHQQAHIGKDFKVMPFGAASLSPSQLWRLIIASGSQGVQQTQAIQG